MNRGPCFPLKALALGALLWSGVRAAEPVENIIPSDSQIYFTVNTRQLIDTELFQKFYREKLDDRKRAQIQVLNQLLGADILKDIDRIHAWGLVDREETMVAAIDGKFDQGKLTTLVKANPSHEVLKESGVEVHKWVDDKGGETRYGAFVAGDRLVIGNSLEAMRKTLAARADQGASVASSPAAAKFRAPADQTFYGLMVASGTTTAPAELAALRDLSTATISGKFSSSGLASGALLEMKSAQAARDMGDLLTGLLALARMQRDNPELRELVSAITINPAPSPNSVAIGLEVKQEKLIKLIEETEVK